MRIIAVLLLSTLVVLACKKKEMPTAPNAPVLSHPENNSECTSGTDINNLSSQVEFRWQASIDADTYKLIVTNLNTNNSQNMTTAMTSASLPLMKGAPYSWSVTSLKTGVIANSTSATWVFYNSGSQTSFAPFPASLIEPNMGANVLKDMNNDVSLKWSGTDLDNDLEGFDIYFSTENPPTTLISSHGAQVSSTKVAVSADTVYYWKVVSKDAEGNSSDSRVFEFRVF